MKNVILARSGNAPAEETFRDQIIRILEHPGFDGAIGIVILLNAVSIGVEQSLQLQNQDTTGLKVLEVLFLLAYTIELAFRFIAHGLEMVKDDWVKLDAFLVSLGLLTTSLDLFLPESPQVLAPLMVFRTARLLRLAKTARLFSRIQKFWMMIRGFSNSGPWLFYAFIFLFLLLYGFSVLAVELITKHPLNMGPDPDPDFQAHVHMYFRSLPITMLTLLHFVCLDQMSTAYKPLVEVDEWLALFFVSVMVVLGIVLMNLISAVIFASTLENNSAEEDFRKKAQEEEYTTLVKELRSLFTRLDEDKSGKLSRDEVMNMEPQDQERMCEALGVSTPVQIFNAIDVEKQGEVSINDFFDVIYDIVAAKSSVGLKRMEMQVERMHWRVRESFIIQTEMQLSLDRLADKMLATKELSANGSEADEKPSSGKAQRLKAQRLKEQEKSSPRRTALTEPATVQLSANGSEAAKATLSAEATPKWAKQLLANLHCYQEQVSVMMLKLDVKLADEKEGWPLPHSSRTGKSGGKSAVEAKAIQVKATRLSDTSGLQEGKMTAGELPPSSQLISYLSSTLLSDTSGLQEGKMAAGERPPSSQLTSPRAKPHAKALATGPNSAPPESNMVPPNPNTSLIPVSPSLAVGRGQLASADLMARDSMGMELPADDAGVDLDFQHCRPASPPGF